jgi:S-adenosylmethionine:tRNA-ribosyltransferase-isomerase (queuine synthetase)
MGAKLKIISAIKPKYVIHLAAQPLVLNSYIEPRETFETNVLGTVNLLDTLVVNSSTSKIVIATTDKVYKQKKFTKSFKESDSLGGKDPYSWSKVGTEAAIGAWQQISKTQDGPKIISVRAGNVIGGGDSSQNRLLPDLIKGFITNSSVEIRNPNSTRPWQHVLDPLSGYLLALAKDTKENTFNFSAKKIIQSNGKFVIEFSWDYPQLTFSEILNHIGNIPLPPYIQRKTSEQDKDRYQTTYAIEEGSVAAPTAGLHFSKDVFNSLNEKNIDQKYLTLHVGAGTFMPVKSATIDEHNMHAEFVEVTKDLIQFLFEHAAQKEAKNLKDKNTQPIIAVGTTSLRTIESLYWMGVKAYLHMQENSKYIGQQDLNLGQWEAYELADHQIPVQLAMKALINWLDDHKASKLIAKTQLMVTPGYDFKICEALVTNFHQPKSTLLLIIAAITGDKWKLVYHHALNNAYRFLSYGDGCLFWIKQSVK